MKKVIVNVVGAKDGKAVNGITKYHITLQISLAANKYAAKEYTSKVYKVTLSEDSETSMNEDLEIFKASVGKTENLPTEVSEYLEMVNLVDFDTSKLCEKGQHFEYFTANNEWVRADLLPLGGCLPPEVLVAKKRAQIQRHLAANDNRYRIVSD